MSNQKNNKQQQEGRISSVTTPDDLADKIENLSVEKKKTPLAPQMAPAIRDDKEEIKLISNLHEIKIKPIEVHIYNISISTLTSNGSSKDLTKGSAASRTDRNEIIVAALRVALHMYQLLKDGEGAFYDGNEKIFSSVSLDKRLDKNTFHVLIDKLPKNIRNKIGSHNISEIVIEVHVESSTTINTEDFKQTRFNMEEMKNNDQSVFNFLDRLTNTPFELSGNYTAFRGGKLFPKTGFREIKRNGQELVTGMSKGITTVNDKDEHSLALVIDAKKGQFFRRQPLVKYLEETIRWKGLNDRVDYKKMNEMVKGLQLVQIGQDKQQIGFPFTATGITDKSIRDITVIRKSQKIPLLDDPTFVKYRQYDHLPAIVVSGNNKEGKMFENYYPITDLWLTGNQKVPLSKQNGVPPPMKVNDRFNENYGMVQELRQSEESEILAAFGVSISEDPIQPTAIRRDLPTVSYAGSQSQATARWKMKQRDKYVEPAHINYIFVGFPPNEKDEKDVKELCDNLSILANDNGLSATLLAQHVQGTTVEKNVRSIFEWASKTTGKEETKKNCLILYFDNKDSTSHGYLKLFEREYGITSQHITMEVVRKKGGDTCLNILNKMNIKMGGLNYSIMPDKYAQHDWITNGKTLIVGYDVCHPTHLPQDKEKKPPTSASIIGFSFNGAKNPLYFIGDFHFQRPLSEQVEDNILIQRIQWMVNLFRKNRECLPESIVIFRDGVSDGQFKMVIEEEFEAIKHGVNDFKEVHNVSDWNPKFVLIIITKRHDKRFAVECEKRVENPKAGTVVDDQVVRTDFTHFYIQPHDAIMGSVKMNSVYVMVNDLQKEGETQDRIQATIMALAFNHQISNNSTSLPEPVYQADEWAKRGKLIWDTYVSMKREFPRLTTWNRNVYSTAPIDYENMTKMYALKDTHLEERRVNA